MQRIGSIFWSSLGKKFISAITGLGLVIYTIAHLLGNLALLRGDPDPFNKYAHFLESLGWFLVIIELGLLAFFLFHIFMGITVWLDKRRARPEAYVKKTDAKGASKMTFSSKTMIYSGLILLLFLIVHVKTFKYGPGMEEGYITIVNGVPMRDLYRLVIEIFSDKWYVLGYVGAMVFLGFHLRHGFWSAFQSLGMQHPRLTPLIYAVGIVLAIILAVGFLFLPIWIYLKGGAA